MRLYIALAFLSTFKCIVPVSLLNDPNLDRDPLTTRVTYITRVVYVKMSKYSRFVVSEGENVRKLTLA